MTYYQYQHPMIPYSLSLFRGVRILEPLIYLGTFPDSLTEIPANNLYKFRFFANFAYAKQFIYKSKHIGQ